MNRPDPLATGRVEMGPAEGAGLLLGQSAEGIVGVGRAIPIGYVAGGVVAHFSIDATGGGVARCEQPIRGRGDHDRAQLNHAARGTGFHPGQVPEGVVGVALRIARGRA